MSRFEDFDDNELFMLVAGIKRLQEYTHKKLMDNPCGPDQTSDLSFEQNIMQDLFTEAHTLGVKRKKEYHSTATMVSL